MVIRPWYDDIDDLVDRISRLSIHTPILHVAKSVGALLSRDENAEALAILDTNLRMAKDLSARRAVLHLWHGPGSDKNIHNNIANLGRMRELASEYDTELLVENIPCENTDEIQLLTEISDRYPDQRFVFDTKNAAFCDHMDEEHLGLIFDSVPIEHIHLNDYSGAPRRWENVRDYDFAGEGEIDFQLFFRVLHQRSYSGKFTIETPITDRDGRIAFARIEDKIQRIREMHHLLTFDGSDMLGGQETST